MDYFRSRDGGLLSVIPVDGTSGIGTGEIALQRKRNFVERGKKNNAQQKEDREISEKHQTQVMWFVLVCFAVFFAFVV